MAKLKEMASSENIPTSLSPDEDPAPLHSIVCFSPDNAEQPCPICGGLGWIRYNVPPGHEKFGRLWRCPNFPVEEDLERQERLREISNLGAFKACTFDNFEINNPMYSQSENQSLLFAHKKALDFARDLDGWLLLEGTFGCGKTHLAAAAGNARIDRGDSVLFITTPDLLDHLRSAFGPHAEVGYDELFNRIRSIRLLILDDLGVENPSEWAQEKLFQILNHRYTQQLPTIITTNNSLDDLDPRLRSRLLDTRMVHRVIISAPDYRSATRNERDLLLSRLNDYQQMTFDTFQFEQYVTPQERENLRRAVHLAGSFASDPHAQDYRWLVLGGGYGTGKTHLAAAIANELKYSRQNVMFMTAPELLDYLRTTFNPDVRISFDQLFNRIREVDILILDDLRTVTTSAWSREKLFQIMDYRYVSRMLTVVTLVDFKAIDDRLQTRLSDTRLCKLFHLQVRSYVDRLRGR